MLERPEAPVTGCDGRRWYVVYCKSQKEDVAEFHFRLKGVQVFFPRLQLPHYAPRWKRVVPLFPSYLFARMHVCESACDEYHDVRWSPGVKNFVGLNGKPTPLDEEVVGFIVRQADPRGIIAARPNLRTGQEVQITGGPFEGIVAIVEQPPNAKGRVKVLMQLLGQHAIKADVPMRFVGTDWVF